MQLVDENYKLLNPTANVRRVPWGWGVTTFTSYVQGVRDHGAFVWEEEEVSYFALTDTEEQQIRGAWRDYLAGAITVDRPTDTGTIQCRK